MNRVLTSGILRGGDFRRLLWKLLEEHDQVEVVLSLSRHLLPNAEEILEMMDSWPELLHWRTARLRRFLVSFGVPFRVGEETQA